MSRPDLYLWDQITVEHMAANECSARVLGPMSFLKFCHIAKLKGQKRQVARVFFHHLGMYIYADDLGNCTYGQMPKAPVAVLFKEPKSAPGDDRKSLRATAPTTWHDPRAVGDPHPGFYRLRVAKGGPWSPAIIYRPCPIEMHHDVWNWLDRWPRLVAQIDGIEVEVDRVWTWAERITAAEYEFLRGDHAWCRAHAGHLPEGKPQYGVDISQIPPIF